GGAGPATPRSDGVRGPLDGPGGAVPALGHGRCLVTADRHAGRGRRTRHAGGEDEGLLARLPRRDGQAPDRPPAAVPVLRAAEEAPVLGAPPRAVLARAAGH